jgi:hypothetical protein
LTPLLPLLLVVLIYMLLLLLLLVQHYCMLLLLVVLIHCVPWLLLLLVVAWQCLLLLQAMHPSSLQAGQHTSPPTAPAPALWLLPQSPSAHSPNHGPELLLLLSG